MKHKILCALIFSAFNLLSCSKKAESEIETISINFSDAESNLTLSDILAGEPEIIPLGNYRSSDSSLVYLKQISKLEIKDENIFILDFFAGTLYSFSKSGEFMETIGGRGDGPGQYLEPLDFYLDKDGIAILDYGKILHYDQDGEFIESKRTNGTIGSGVKKLNEEQFILVGAGRDTDNLIFTDGEFTPVKSYFPYITRALNVMPINPLYENSEGEFIYRRNFIDTLFSVSNGQFPKPYLIIDYGEKKFDYTRFLGTKTTDVDIQNKSSEYCRTHYFYESDNYQYLEFFLKEEQWINIHSKVSGKSVLFKKSELLDDVTFVRNSYVVGVSGDKFIFQSRPHLVAEGLQNIIVNEESSAHLKKLKSLTDSLDKEGNPILFLVEFDF